MSEEIKFQDLTIEANVTESTTKILEDVYSIYKENYSDVWDKELWGYLIEDMLEAYLESSDEYSDMDDSDDTDDLEDDE